jgi:hypothetical protein
MSTPKTAARSVKVADEVWIATALLHRERPDRTEFTVAEIVARAEREHVEGRLRPGVYVHAQRHCVANLPADPARYRMLFATGKSTRRLFRPGDACDPQRERGKTAPVSDEIPARYRALVDWYHQEYTKQSRRPTVKDPLMSARAAGRHLAGVEHPDEDVRRLRESWS